MRSGRTDCGVGLCIWPIVKLMLAAPGIDVNARDDDLRSPLHLAVISDKPKVVRILASTTGVDINGLDSNGKTPLECAIDGWDAHPTHRRLYSIVALLKAGGRLGTNDYTVLYWAVKNNSTHVAKMLLKQPWIDVNAGGRRVPTPLYQAVETQNSYMVKMLLKHPKIDANRGNPLLLAVKDGTLQIAVMLVKCPTLDVTCQAFRKALDMARKRQYTDLVSLMNELWSDVDIDGPISMPAALKTFFKNPCITSLNCVPNVHLRTR
ncbi:Ankyrin repeat domain-containing protein [Plasmodiophora brassicae]